MDTMDLAYEAPTRNEHAAAPAGDLHRRIERRAYELYERRGRAGGLDVQDRLQAEREVTAEAREAADAPELRINM